MARRGARTTVVWVVAGVLVLASAGLTAAAASGFGFAPATASHEPLPVATEPVTRGDLVATVVEPGSVGSTGEQAVRGAGGTVTWLPELGTVVERGGQLARVDDAPIVLLNGTLPAYRVLEQGSVGADVRQLEENLAALGYTGFDVDEHFTWATAEAVRAWQAALGVEETGLVDPAAVHVAPASVRVTAVSAELGDPAGGELVTVANTERVVLVDLDEIDAGYAVVGSAVTARLPDGSSFTATVRQVQTVVTAVQNPQTGTEQTTVLRVSVVPDDPAALDAIGQSTVKVAFTAETREDVLTVPVTALLALAEGGYAVEVVRAGSGSVDADDADASPAPTELVAVETGLFAEGRVEVTGDLAEGDEVVVAS